jgi:GYF domain 2
MKCQTDPGSLRPKASNRVLIPEAQLREFIANGTVTAETLVWTEGMAGWQKAGDIPGLLSGASGPPVVAPSGVPPTTGRTATGQPLSVDFSIERTAYAHP